MRKHLVAAFSILLASGNAGLAQSAPPPIDTTPAWLNSMSSPPVYLPNEPAPVIVPAPAAVPAAPAETAYVPATVPNYAEAGINYYSVTNKYGNGFGQFVNAQYQTDPWNRWSAGVQHAHAFHDNGDAIGIGNTHVFDEDWYSDIGASFSPTGFFYPKSSAGISTNRNPTSSFYPKYRIDASINRKWLEGRNFITTLGFGYDRSRPAMVGHTYTSTLIIAPGAPMVVTKNSSDKTVYSDRNIFVAATYYFPEPWVVQAGVKLNDSMPASVISPSAFAAVTYGMQKHYLISGHYTIANEAYLLSREDGDTVIIGPDTEIVDSHNTIRSYVSNTVGVNWREWVGEDYGFNLGAEYYVNPYYSRTGGIVSVFKEF